jgi:hypothetical protein
VLCWVCTGAAPSLAVQIDYGVGLSATYESNIYKTTTNPAPELYWSYIGAAFIRESNQDLDLRTLIQIEHRKFTKHTFPDDTTAFLDGAALWTLMPRRLTWALEDTFREIQLNVTAPDTPGNRTKSNTLSTGPDLTFTVDSSNSVVVGGRYGRFDVQNSDTDNKRYTGYLRGLHLLSLQSKLSLNAEVTRVFFEPAATAFPNVLQENLYARYESLYAGSGVTLDLGRTHVTQLDGGQSLAGNIERVALFKAFGPASTLRVTYSNEISDTYSDLIRGVTLTAAPLDPGVVVLQGLATADLYHSELATAAYINQDGRFQYTVLALGRKVDFATLDEDYDEKGGRLYATWVQSGTTRFTLSGDFSRRTYSTLLADPTNPAGSPTRVDTDRNYIASMDYKLNRNLTLTMVANLLRRDTNAPGLSYVDRRVMVLAGYSFGHQFDVQSRR